MTVKELKKSLKNHNDNMEVEIVRGNKKECDCIVIITKTEPKRAYVYQ